MSKQTKSILSFSPMFTLFLVFLILKLTETSVVADWSWWWVTAPLWIPPTLFLACIAIWLVAMIIVSITVLIFE